MHFMRHSVHGLEFTGITCVRLLGEIFKRMDLGWNGYKIVRFIDDIILKCNYRGWKETSPLGQNKFSIQMSE